jgi:hypothetical protein
LLQARSWLRVVHGRQFEEPPGLREIHIEPFVRQENVFFALGLEPVVS